MFPSESARASDKQQMFFSSVQNSLVDGSDWHVVNN